MSQGIETVTRTRYECPGCRSSWEDREQAEACLAKHEAARINATPWQNAFIAWSYFEHGSDMGHPTDWPMRGEGQVLTIDETGAYRWDPRLLVEKSDGGREWIRASQVKALEAWERHQAEQAARPVTTPPAGGWVSCSSTG